MDAIAVRELDFSYGSSRILKKIDLTVPEGRFAVLLGENGAGKSTFLKLLLGELPIGGGEGKILLFGRDIRQFKSWQELSCVPGKAAWHPIRTSRLCGGSGTGKPVCPDWTVPLCREEGKRAGTAGSDPGGDGRLCKAADWPSVRRPAAAHPPCESFS